MIEWKKICCAVDFGDPSRVAVEQAADLASRFEAELTLVHVVVLPPPAASDVLVSSRTLTSMQAREDEETLARWRADVEARAGRPVRSRVLAGDPAMEIVRHAREERCDLVVVGTHGRTGIPHLLLGSVAERVARRAPCPVLVELVLLYAEAGPKEELPRAGPVEGKLEEWKEQAERLGAPRATVARTGGPPEVAIVEFASARDIDLVVMGTHGRVDREHMLTGSVAEGVVRNAPCPVLTVRATWKA